MQDKTQLGSVDTEIDTRGIATITFFHPSHNALPGKLLAGLSEAIHEAGKNEKARVIVLKSGGDRTFCAGASFDELVAIRDFETGKKFFMGFARVINAMRRCPKLIIGRVQGKAVGGGVGVAAATDYCLATRYAAVKLSELAIGIGPFVVGPAVERKIGKSAMTQLAINATEWRNAEWARDKGLYADIYDSTEALDAAVADLSERLAASTPEAMEKLKRAFWEEAENWDELLEQRAALSGKLVLSTFTREAIEQFKQKK